MDGTTGLCLYSENIQGYGLLEIDCTTSVTDQSQWLVAQPGQAGSLMNAPTPDLGNNESCVQIDTSGETGMGVLMAECNGGTTQQWVQQADGSLVNASSGQCLSYWTSTAAGNVGNSPVVGVWDCAGGPWTNWYDKAGQWKTVYLSAVTPPPPSTGGGHHHH
jgi:hypothetical protein